MNNKEKTPTEHKNYMHMIQRMIEGKNIDKALDLNIRSYEKALAVDDVRQIAYCIYSFGLLEHAKQNISKAMTYFTQASRIAREHQIEDCLILSLNYRGNIYSIYGELHLAISKYLEALNIVQQSDERKLERVKILNNIGVLYAEMGDIKKAADYAVESLGYVKKLNDDSLMCKIYGNVTELFLCLGELDKAKYYNQANRVLAIKNDIDLEIALAKAYDALILSKEKGPWLQIQTVFDEALSTFDRTPHIIDKCEVVNLFAQECFQRKKYSVAIHYLNMMLTEIEDKKFRHIEINALTLLEKIYVEQNNIQMAYETLSRLSKIKEYTYEHLREREFDRVRNMTSGSKEAEDDNNEEDTFDDIKKLQKSIQILKTLSEIGQHITSCISVEDLVETLYRQIDHIFSFDGFGIGLKGIDSPLFFENRTIGGITVQSEQKNVFTYVDLESLRIIASYVAVAVTNIVRAYDLMIANKKLREVSLKDELTNAFNRRALGQYMHKEFAKGKSGKLPACGIMLDVDFFKQYNDHYGHVCGDQCLQDITTTLRRVLRRQHYQIFRYGGDEFFVVVENCRKEQAIHLLENMVESVRELKLRHDYSEIADYVTISVGAKLIENIDKEYDYIFNEADQALYVVKENGRNGYHIV